MSCSIIHDINANCGNKPFFLLQTNPVFISIETISNDAPAIITTQSNHNMVEGQLFAIEGVKGCPELNSHRDNQRPTLGNGAINLSYFQPAYIDTNNSLILPQINGELISQHVANTGNLRVLQYENVTGCTASFLITDGNNDLVVELTSNDDITIDNPYITVYFTNTTKDLIKSAVKCKYVLTLTYQDDSQITMSTGVISA